ncbi:MAG TPA: lysophospholipid acyltransferase family protein [Methylotenera sp.]|nr:lysophospholipid acyltransferase family protein [Methylotenera sp.]
MPYRGATTANSGIGNMLQTKINYFWRLIATGFCFFMFGLGALVLTLFIFPSLYLFNSEKRGQLARRAIQISFSMFLWLMQTCGVLKLEIKNKERLNQHKNALILANHPTLIDVIAIIGQIPNANCIVKQDLWKNPFVGMVVRTANYINNSESEMLIEECARNLQAGNPLVIFPEGTRSKLGNKLKFKRGAAYIAINSEVPIVLIVITCTPPTLAKGEKWYTIPPRKAHLIVDVQSPISVSELSTNVDGQPFTARQLTKILEEYFTEAISIYGSTVSGNQTTHYPIS